MTGSKLKRLGLVIGSFIRFLVKKVRGKPFSGVWATYEYLDDACEAIMQLRKGGYTKLTAYSPCYRHEIMKALGNPKSRVPVFTLGGGMIGASIAVLMIVWMSLEWVLPVSGKPIVSVNPIVIIAFELTILIGAYATVVGMLILGIRSRLSTKLPKSDRYKTYQRFTQDRFGVVVNCEEALIKKAETILKQNAAEEVICEV